MALVFEKNGDTQAYADDLIGAAQALERAARFLKSQAKVVREHGLIKMDRPNIYRESQAAYVLSVAKHAAEEIEKGGKQ